MITIYTKHDLRGIATEYIEKEDLLRIVDDWLNGEDFYVNGVKYKNDWIDEIKII